MPSIAEILAAKKLKATVLVGAQQAVAEIKPDHNGAEHEPAIPQQSKEPEGEQNPQPAADDTRPEGNFESILRAYPNLEAFKASPAWRILGLVERMRVIGQYKALGRQATAPDSSEGRVLEAEPTGNKTSGEAESKPSDGGFGAVTIYSEPKTILNRYLDLESLKRSPLWAQMDIGRRVLITREYVKQSQLQAAALHAQQQALEQALNAEEKQKAREQEEAAKAAAEKGKADRHETFALSIELNERQKLAVEYARAGKSFVLTGAAGTGKTTACREIARAFLQAGDLGRHTFKVGDGLKQTSHGIAFCSYTRRATANIRRALHRDPELAEELEVNVVTIHKLLEYEPEFYIGEDGKNKMRFVPKRDASNPLDIRVLCIEEGSMLGLDLYEKLFAALRPDTIIIFVGDINQLPPVFGKSIMNYALGQLPVIELTEVYRQALDSGVIVNAHNILKGQVPVENKDTQLVTGSQKEHVGQERMSRALGSMFFKLWDAGEYDPEQDIILSPWNKQPCGTDNLNNWIAQFLGEKRNAMVYEILAGRRKMYLAVGDRVMYEKQDGIITAIRHNTNYLGKPPQPAGTDVTRFGMRKMSENATHEDFEAMAGGYANINIDEVQDEEKKQQSSHVVEITLDDGRKDYLRSIGDYAENVFSLGYVLTVHKAQGCEWRKVFVILHKDHTLGGFLTRELLYTAITRAREKVILIAKPDTIAKAVKQQTIKGNTLEEKIQSINSGAQNIGSYPVLKLSKSKEKKDV